MVAEDPPEMPTEETTRSPTSLPRVGSLLSHHSARSLARVVSLASLAKANACPERGALELKAIPQFKVITLVISNRCGFLAKAGEASVAAVSEFASGEVSRITGHSATHKGVLDLFQADHFCSSHNSVRPCPSHRESAVQYAWAVMTERSVAGDGLAALPMSAACSNGRARCGDYGCDTQQRFMSVGGVSSMVAVEDRLAARWRSGVLIDDSTHADAQTRWDCRLMERIVYAKRGSDQPTFLWQVAREKVAGSAARNPKKKAANPWEAFNSALLFWMDGLVDDADRSIGLYLAAAQPPATGSSA
eukprot:gene57304-biopygen88564